MPKKLIIFLLVFLYVECLKEGETITIEINTIETKTIGKKGTVFLKCSSSSHIEDTERKTCFTSKILNGQKLTDINCGIWKQPNDDLYIFCKIEESIETGEYEILFNETMPFSYKGNQVNLEYPQEEIKFKKVDKEIIDLYADEQTINIEEGKDVYDLKFNINSYGGEKIILNYNIPLDCKKTDEELICPITKSKFEEFLSENETESNIQYIDSNEGMKNLPFVRTFNILYEQKQKIDIDINIKTLVTKKVRTMENIVYEAEATNIDKIFSIEHFYLTFVVSGNNDKDLECFFRKYDDMHLYLICLVKNEGVYHLKKIENAQKVENINVKYNFIIKPVTIEDTIEVKNEGSLIYYSYPEILDFTSEKSLSIILYTSDSVKLEGITFNEDKTDLTCENFAKYYKKCEVPKEHFDGKGIGDYFIKHNDGSGNKLISYEVSPIKVDYPDSNGNKIITVSLFFSLALILMMI